MKTVVPFVAVKVTGDPLSPLTEASTLYSPGLFPSVSVDSASPSESVTVVELESSDPLLP